MSKINTLNQYILLTRLNQPIGFLLLMLPCMWGILAACNSINDISNNWFLIFLLIIGSIVMRSAGCIINDIFDRNYDKKVSRTVLRPLAKGTITIFDACICFIFLSLLQCYTFFLAVSAFGIEIDFLTSSFLYISTSLVTVLAMINFVGFFELIISFSASFIIEDFIDMALIAFGFRIIYIFALISAILMCSIFEKLKKN